MVNLTIDGKKISAPNGTTVLKAAESSGIEIPTLCDHPSLKAYGGCRMCVVEIEGIRNLQTSCTLPILENMVVHTNTDRVKSARKFILTMLFSERNHFCPFCVVNDGDCELQQAAYDAEMTHWPIQPNWKPFNIDASHANIIHDHNRCILCRRCVRACSELIGNNTLGVQDRGADCMIIADLGVPLGESTCVSCGACIQVCPTGSLIDRWSAFRGQSEELEKTVTICIGCSIGCGVTVYTKDDHLIKIEGNFSSSPNKGILCKTGRFLPLENSAKRVQSPMVRKDGKLVQATWQEALGQIASTTKPIMEEKEDQIAGLVSPRLSVEAMYLFKEIFAKSIGSPAVTSLDEERYLSIPYKVNESFNKPIETRLENIEQADLLILLDTDLVNDHEVASFLVKRSVLNGTKLLRIGSTDNPLDNIAAKTLKGKANSTAVDILDGISAALLMADAKKTETGTTVNNEEERASSGTGLTLMDFNQAATLIQSAERPIIIYGRCDEQADTARIAAKISEFARLSGAVQEAWNGLFSLKGKANGYAAGQYHLDNPIQIDGKQIVYLALGDDQPAPDLIQALEKTPFLIVQAGYLGEITAMADVVLPAAIWGEESGHYLNVNGKINKAVQFKTTKTDCKSNYEILNLLATALNLEEQCGKDWRDSLQDRLSLNVVEN